jgi:hypothetical protein
VGDMRSCGEWAVVDTAGAKKGMPASPVPANRRVHGPNANTTQPLNLIFGDLNATTLEK